MYSCHSLSWHWLNMMRGHFFLWDNNTRIQTLGLLGLFSSFSTFRFPTWSRSRSSPEFIKKIKYWPWSTFLYIICIKPHQNAIEYQLNLVKLQWKLLWYIIEFNVNTSHMRSLLFWSRYVCSSNAIMLNWSIYDTSHSYNYRPFKCPLLLILPWTCRLLQV